MPAQPSGITPSPPSTSSHGLAVVGAQSRADRAGTPMLGDLLDETAHLITRYVKLPVKDVAVLMACWIALTYTYERFRYCGYLALRSATPRCGKSKLLRILCLLAVGCPPITANPTGAVLFRSKRRVLILDEVDRLRNADKDNFGVVISILNVGFEKGAIVERAERGKGGQFEVKEFPVYRPVALAGIESLADTLSDRTFQVKMERSAQRMPRFNLRLVEELGAQLRVGFQSWADRYGPAIDPLYDQLPDELASFKGLDDRFQDIAEPLWVLAALADMERESGPAILPRLNKGLRAAAGSREPSGREAELRAFLEMVGPLAENTEEIFLSSSQLIDMCRQREELSRLESGRALAGFLKHFDLCPLSNGKLRGYMLRQEWVNTWKARYGYE